MRYVEAELAYLDQTMVVAGVDEVGRGPLAGPVYAAAVILDPAKNIAGLADSKRLSPARRALLDVQIRAHARAWSLGVASIEEIDCLNILQASLLAMQRAVQALGILPDYVLVDGRQCPVLGCPSLAIIKGDEKVLAISAASIIAKVARDCYMVELDMQYPGYGFAGHKGYPTPAHIKALRSLGVSPVHRLSFAPVRRCLQPAGMS
jgi:ribonuclease HII